MEHFEHNFMHPEVWPYLQPYSLSIPIAGKGKRNNCTLDCKIYIKILLGVEGGQIGISVPPDYIPFLFILIHHLSSYSYDHRGLGQQQASEKLCSSSAGYSLKNKGKCISSLSSKSNTQVKGSAGFPCAVHR